MVSDEKRRQDILTQLLDLLVYFRDNPDFNYAAHVVLNVSSCEEGRAVLFEDKRFV